MRANLSMILLAGLLPLQVSVHADAPLVHDVLAPAHDLTPELVGPASAPAAAASPGAAPASHDAPLAQSSTTEPNAAAAAAQSGDSTALAAWAWTWLEVGMLVTAAIALLALALRWTRTRGLVTFWRSLLGLALAVNGVVLFALTLWEAYALGATTDRAWLAWVAAASALVLLAGSLVAGIGHARAAPPPAPSIA